MPSARAAVYDGAARHARLRLMPPAIQARRHKPGFALQTEMARIFRAMQLAALALPLLAIILQLGNSISVKEMLLLLLASVCLFWIGRLLEGYAAR